MILISGNLSNNPEKISRVTQALGPQPGDSAGRQWVAVPVCRRLAGSGPGDKRGQGRNGRNGYDERGEERQWKSAGCPNGDRDALDTLRFRYQMLKELHDDDGAG